MHPSIGHINDELAIATETARKGKRLQAKLTSRQSDIGRLRPAEKKLRLLW